MVLFMILFVAFTRRRIGRVSALTASALPATVTSTSCAEWSTSREPSRESQVFLLNRSRYFLQGFFFRWFKSKFYKRLGLWLVFTADDESGLNLKQQWPSAKQTFVHLEHTTKLKRVVKFSIKCWNDKLLHYTILSESFLWNVKPKPEYRLNSVQLKSSDVIWHPS